MSVFKIGCSHGYLKDCPAVGCRNANPLAPDDLRNFFGRESDPKKAQALMKRSPEAYAAKKKLAQEAGLIVTPLTRNWDEPE